jgi:uncharacterized membrane protein YgdD (TMEM256/DUF423 family)
MIVSRFWLALAGVNGALGVAFGAVGAHGGNPLAGFVQTASQFQLFHALALLALAFILPRAEGRGRQAFAAAAFLFLLGILLFSGSLYLRALAGMETATILAPYGGTGLILGWAAMILAALLSRRVS